MTEFEIMNRKIRAGQQRECRLRKRLEENRKMHDEEMIREYDYGNGLEKALSELKEVSDANVTAINHAYDNTLDEWGRDLRRLRAWRLATLAALLAGAVIGRSIA